MNARLSRRTALGLITIMVASPLLASPVRAEDVVLAIKGYDPVAYFTDGHPVQGRQDFEYVWDDHVYRFASAEHLNMFKTDPVRYAPQFGNFCAMALAKGQVVVAHPE